MCAPGMKPPCIQMRPASSLSTPCRFFPVHNPAPDTPGSVGLQPAADSRHVQRHRHERHVSGACHDLVPSFCPSRLRMCPPFDSAVRVGVQPAADSRHVQRHNHVPHVSGALCARAMHLIPSFCPFRLRMCPPFDSAGRFGVQPTADDRHFQRHIHEPHAFGALRACTPDPQLGPSPAFTCAAVAPPPSAS